MTDNKAMLRAWLSLLRAGAVLKKNLDARFRAEAGLSISRFDVLAALERAGPQGLRAGALSERLMVTEGNTTQVTAPLIRDGLVRRRRDPEDGRAVIFALTKKGERQFAAAAAMHREWVAAAFSSLSGSELATLQSLLNRVCLPDIAHAETKDAA